MKIPKLVRLIVVIVLVLFIVLLLVQWFSMKASLNQMQKTLKIQQVNQKVLEFSNFFVDKVLLSQNEVSFEDRLKMENMVRDLGDQQIFDQWSKFTKSTETQQVQKELVNLFKLLISKISM